VTRPLHGLKTWYYGNSSTRRHTVVVGKLHRRHASSQVGQSFAVHRLSQLWAPTGGIETSKDAQDEAHALLVKAGFLRQAQSGIFHLLPLGNRVQQKLEQLIDKHMSSLGASKISLSSISSEELWERSGRLSGHGSELFRLTDRKDTKLLLSPTHEEEVTSLVASIVKSYRDLPMRLYQISRKYRDEGRPRQGLLRGREFLMKDLYTFDVTEDAARSTYEKVGAAYRAFLDELNVPYLVAKADSGSMGGDLSHEYHFVSPTGEDNVIVCQSCKHTINEELSIRELNDTTALLEKAEDVKTATWFGISKDRRILIQGVYPRYELIRSSEQERVRVKNEINLYAVKAALHDIDLDTGVENPRDLWQPGPESMLICLIDPRLPPRKYLDLSKFDTASDYQTVMSNKRASVNKKPVLLTRTFTGDTCSICTDGHVTVEKAIEIGHTFHLGTRYSKPLEAKIVDSAGTQKHLEMGCHGIGVSRLIGAIAAQMMDKKGLNWPAIIAPFNICVVYAEEHNEAADAMYERLRNHSADFDVVLDDRPKRLGWKLMDADMIGYPIIVVIGQAWKTGARRVEVQSRRLKVKKEVEETELENVLSDLLKQL